ncbi:zinc-dependent metalloprotease [Oceanicaulis alexandrii]|uniref:zinc-dependent metalloprotease n=1 Tax=Oceanicaulis alexandrii TaxID=153233 RepID=UPI0035D0428E
MSQFRSLWFTAAIAAIIAGSPAFAQEDEGDEDEAQTIEGFTEEFETIDGLFPLYRNPEDGALYMEIAADQLDDEFVYFTYAEDGAPRTGLFRGQFRDNRVLTFARHYGEIEISAENTSFSFDEDNALSRASSANITRAPLAVLEIEAETEGEDDAPDRFLVQIDSLLSGEDLSQIKPNAPRGPGAEDAFSMGRLSGDRTRVLDIRNYPENTDVVVEYVYTEDSPRNGGGAEITDARAVAVTVQHSFLALPEDGYEPRADDFRVGYFGQRVTNLTDTSVTPYDDVINRWRLVKQDPTAEISDPVEPIVWWIENTTPVELRDIIRDAALTWNIAFEAAGFSNALEVRVQPDDADWDAGDIRYNVLRWTSSPTPPFGGYGPSFTHPRTGEIMGADIMLEYVFMTNRIRYSELFDVAGLSQWLPAEQLAEATGEPVIEHDHDAHGAMCNFAEHLQMETLSGVAALQAQGATSVEVDELIRQSLHYLVIHEIGHTLGLMHNMRATSTISLDDLANGETVTGSIMDYPALNLPTQDDASVQYSQETPGPYDIWAISYGYNPDTEALPALLEQSTDPALAFGNDADDLRAPGRHSDPRVMINDLSSDPVSWAGQRVELINDTLRTLPENFEIEGETYQPLLTSYLVLSGQRFGAANVASRHIGGIYNNRSVVGQPGAETPFIPVSREKQEQALDVLDAALFGPDAFAAEEAYLDHLQRQRRFFDHFGTDEDPALHDRVFNQQRAVMAHLLHANMLERMNDARQYGGEYPVADYLQDLTQVVYAADIRGEPNTYRQNLQVEYLRRLISIVGDGDYSPVARSAALAAIHDVKGWVGPDWMPDLMGSREAKAHRAHLRALINAFEG